MDLEKTAQRLLKLADDIEAEASACSYLICGKCNHTASLAEINDQRKKLAAQTDPAMTVKKVTVNDKVACPACKGAMAYVASDESERFYVNDKEAGYEENAESVTEPQKTPEEDVVTEEEEVPPSKKPIPPIPVPGEAPVDSTPAPAPESDIVPDADMDSLFEDVETQAKGKEMPTGTPEEVPDTMDDVSPEAPTPEAPNIETPKPEAELPEIPSPEAPTETPEEIPEEPSETPPEAPTGEPEVPAETPEETPPETPEVPEPEETPPELPPEESPVAPDSGALKADPGLEQVTEEEAEEKKEPPKFHSKEAAERYQASINRYINH